MKSKILKKLIQKLPPGVSVGFPSGISVDPGAIAQYLCRESTVDELNEIQRQLADLWLSLRDGFLALQPQLQAVGVRNEQQYRDLLIAIEHILRRVELPPCFLLAVEWLAELLERNFLIKFKGPDSDYVELLSNNFRSLFFYFFNKHILFGKFNYLVISGYEGSGKTFNTLLLALQLSREGYSVYYCPDIRESVLTPGSIRPIATMNDNSIIVIIDNLQNDVEKAEMLVKAISRASKSNKSPSFILLTRPLDEDTFKDIFGKSKGERPVIEMKDKFIEFNRLVGLFFESRGEPEAASRFLKTVDSVRFRGSVLKYRNMAFWNEVLRSLPEDRPWSLTEEEILRHAHSFFRRKEPHLLDFHEPLTRLLPFFSHGIPVHREYACQLIGAGAEEFLRKLKQHRLIRIVEYDWETDQYTNTWAPVISPGLHRSTMKLLRYLFQKYYRYSEDHTEAIADYAEHFPHNLYYILSPYYDPEELRLLFTNSRICEITRHYLVERHLGKKLDRVIKYLASLPEEIRDSLFDEQVMQAFSQQVNGEQAYLVSKMYLFRALYRAHPQKAYDLFTRITPEAVSKTFLADETKTGITSLAKWMEIFKNIYYFATTPEAKGAVQDFVRRVIDQCQPEFLRRFEFRDMYFTQLHWMLKRLHGLKLANYFLRGITPDKLLEFICTKDTNIVELSRYVLLNARHTFLAEPDGSQRRYYDILKEKLSYEDIKRVFDNKRSDLYDLIINANHDFVAKALVRYADDPEFERKAAEETSYLREKSLALIQKNFLLTDDEREKVANAIVKAAGL